MNHSWFAILAAALIGALCVATCEAAENGGVYIGGGAGHATITDSTVNPNGPGTIDFDSSDTGWKAFIGYRLSAIPLVDLAAEVGYTDFGKPSQTSLGQNVQYKLHGVDLAGLAILPIGPVDIYGKIGGLYWTVDKDIGTSTSSRNGTSPFYGAGIGLNVWKLGIRAEYEYYDVHSISHAQLYSVSVLFRF